jgi:hypothetical protein
VFGNMWFAFDSNMLCDLGDGNRGMGHVLSALDGLSRTRYDLAILLFC